MSEQSNKLSRETLRALNDAALLVAREVNLEQVLEHIVEAARTLVGAQYAALGLPNSHGLLDAFIHSGIPSDLVKQIGHLPEGHGLLGAIIAEKRSIRLPKIDADRRSVGFPAGHPPMDSFLGVPVVAGDKVLGNLYLTNKGDGVEFSAEDQNVVEMLAAHAAIAIQNAHLYEQVEQLAIVDERQRIGMDLHDGVIQSIYAVGLTLDSLKLTLPDESESHTLIDQSMRGLNEAIQDIRNFIMDLRPRRFQGDLAQGIAQLAREFQANTLTPVSVNLTASTGNLSPARARAFFLTLQEALANIARHAKASQVEIDLFEGADAHSLRIKDDGIGFDTTDSSRRIGHGLANMQSRAQNENGVFTIQSAPSQGTVITFSLPV